MGRPLRETQERAHDVAAVAFAKPRVTAGTRPKTKSLPPEGGQDTGSTGHGTLMAAAVKP